MSRQPFDTGQRPSQSVEGIVQQLQPSTYDASSSHVVPSTSLATQPFVTSSSSSSASSSLPTTTENLDNFNSNFSNSTPTTELNHEEENNLTAALVAALVQTRDSIRPPPPPPTNPQLGGGGESSFDFTSLLRGGGGGDHHHQVEETTTTTTTTRTMGLEERGNLGLGSVTTRSGRRTKPTPGAVSYSTNNISTSSDQDSSSGEKKSNSGGGGSRVRWSSQEDEELVKLIKEEPPLTWNQMGERLGRPGAGCAMRWYNFIRQSVGKTLADELSNKMRTGGGAGGGKTNSLNNMDQPPPVPLKKKKQQQQRPSVQTEKERAVSEEEGSNRSSLSRDNSIQPSSQMQVGSSRTATLVQQEEQVPDIPIEEAQVEEPVLLLPTPPPPRQSSTTSKSERKFPGGYPTTGELVPLQTIPNELLPPPLPPHPSKPGHPFPRPLIAHSNSGPNFLPDQALVQNPPIPFIKNTVIRGRRTHDAKSLAEKIEMEQKEKELKMKAKESESQQQHQQQQQQSDQQQQEQDDETGDIKTKKSSSSSSKGKQKKVHPCPAVNCGAAFKRSEHLKRHFKSVHRGEKPFPCKIESCGKSFSRKDNLQQHQAMVHGVRALYTYSDGTVSVNPPDVGVGGGIDDEEPVSISYEAVDITKTARGAARQARQEAKAKRQEEKQKLSTTSNGNGKRRRTSSNSQSREPDSGQEGEEEEEEDSMQKREVQEGDDEGAEGQDHFSCSLNALGSTRPTRKLTKFIPTTTTTNTTGIRTPSTVQGLMSTSSAATQSFSIGPSSHERGNYERRSFSAESNERGGGGNVLVGEKRGRENNETGLGGGGGSIDKRLRLTGDTSQSDELDPALRVLADATTMTTTSSSISIPSSASSSIAPYSSGLSPLIQHALEQRIAQPSRDIPVNPTAAPYPIPELLQPTARPFATSASSNLSNLPVSTMRTEDYNVEGNE